MVQDGSGLTAHVGRIQAGHPLQKIRRPLPLEYLHRKHVRQKGEEHRKESGQATGHPLPFSRPIREPQRQRAGNHPQGTPEAKAPPQRIQGRGQKVYFSIHSSSPFL